MVRRGSEGFESDMGESKSQMYIATHLWLGYCRHMWTELIWIQNPDSNPHRDVDYVNWFQMHISVFTPNPSYANLDLKPGWVACVNKAIKTTRKLQDVLVRRPFSVAIISTCCTNWYYCNWRRFTDQNILQLFCCFYIAATCSKTIHISGLYV